MEMEIAQHDAATEVGSYFVANYPPFSAWTAEQVPAAQEALDTPAGSDDPPLGLYLHIPFCRQRCKFCYFRVYTDKNARDIDEYLRALNQEIALYARRPRLEGRAFDFVYFGGGTPSYLSGEQLQRLVDRIAQHWPWDHAREVTFECEPGTLRKHKLETIKAIGTTRLSLGIEHFDDDVLVINGRAHKSPEIHRSYRWAREVGFAQVNIDLIAGMVGDTPSKWRHTVDRALDLAPDSVTIYQMELPHNTVMARESNANRVPTPVADWPTKRAWVDAAFAVFERAGYVASSGYTLVRPEQHLGFVYRDGLWHGAELVGTGVASFSHVGGVHFQNVDDWDAYLAALSRDELPINRALPISEHERLTRELILQLKLGRIDAGYFRVKFGREINQVFGDAFTSLIDDGCATIEGDDIRLTRAGLLRVDGLLPRFYEPRYRRARYT